MLPALTFMNILWQESVVGIKIRKQKKQSNFVDQSSLALYYKLTSFISCAKVSLSCEDAITPVRKNIIFRHATASTNEHYEVQQNST